MKKPLDGIKVLDFSKVLAGPLCTQYLSDLGADIVKIEPVNTGDETRYWPPQRREQFGSVFLAVNRNKRSLAINLKSQEGLEIIYNLVPFFDVVIENFSTGVADRLGIGEKSIRSLNQRLIYCSISGFGREGPLKDAAGYDVILQAYSGMMSLTGEKDSGHIRIPISPIDQVTGINALSGILAALYAREKTGEGCYVETSLFESAVALLNHPLQSYWERGTQSERWGSSHESLCPYQAFDAFDGPVMIGVANDNLWKKFCKIADLDSLLEDSRYQTNSGRAKHRELVVDHVQKVVEKQSVDYWVKKLTSVGVPVAPINTLEQMLALEHTDARKIILDYELSEGDRAKAVATPILFNHIPRSVSLPPPLLGQHTNEILEEFGVEKKKIDDLRVRGIVG